MGDKMMSCTNIYIYGQQLAGGDFRCNVGVMGGSIILPNQIG